MSMPGPAPSVNSPFRRCGMPQANSATSTPRWMSPLASGIVLPCSRARRSASESISPAIRSRNFIMTRARRCGLVRRPGGLGGAGVLDGRPHLRLRGQRHLRDHLAGHRLIDVADAAGGPFDLPSADEMPDPAHAVSPQAFQRLYPTAVMLRGERSEPRSTQSVSTPVRCVLRGSALTGFAPQDEEDYDIG